MQSALVPLAHLGLTGVSVFIVAKLLPGIQASSLKASIFFAFVVGVLNAIVWGALAVFAVSFTIVTVGLGALILNGVVFLLASKVVEGVRISGCMTAAIASLGVSLVNAAMHPFFGRWAP